MSFSARWRDIPTRPLVREALDWQQHAVCRNEPLELFFGPDRHEGESQRKERESRAKMFCSGCPVRTECLDYSITQDRKSTRLNSSHVAISYAVFCLKKNKSTHH